MLTDDGGWIVIQRNKRYSAVNFDREWTDYEKGFGDLNTEFWYGLEETHCLTQRGQWEMRVDYQRTYSTWSYLHYTNFSVRAANDDYSITIGGFTGVGSDYFATHPHNVVKFSTSDNDNDRYGGNCADNLNHGWWHNSCTYIFINYRLPCIYNFYVLTTEMKIRPRLHHTVTSTRIVPFDDRLNTIHIVLCIYHYAHIISTCSCNILVICYCHYVILFH